MHLNEGVCVLLHEELLPATLIRRYKRFLADVEIAGEKDPVTVHCPNPGSMIGVAEPGMKIWLRRARNPEAKLPYGWVLTELESGFVCVDTLMANKIVYEALKTGLIRELAGYKDLAKERTFQSSRFDFFLSGHKSRPDCFMEVKSTTLAEGEFAMFPDAKTERGRKHLAELVDCKRQGLRAVQFYCVSRSDKKIFRAAEKIDPLYAAALETASKSGVEILAYDTLFLQGTGGSFEISLGKPVPLSF